MEKGNEGDEIVFLSLRQIECGIPDDVVKVSQISADLLVAIISRCLLLITDGEVKFPVALPQNIASRHRICTSIATKIKELGFLSDCGYNQLLYPVENQTRELLKWLVDKLPRSEEEGVQEALGANALMNRRIMQSLKDWKSKPWKLQFCSKGTVLRNVYEHRQFRTIPGLLEKRSSDEADMKTIQVFQRAAECKISVESSMFERHALEHIADAAYALRLERDFAEAELAANGEDHDGVEDGAAGESKGGSEKKSAKVAGALTQKAVRAALLRAVIGSDSSVEGDTGSGPVAEAAVSADGGSSSSSSRTRLAKKLQQGQSLQDTIQDIVKDHESVVGSRAAGGPGERGTRFSHAVEFGQEATAAQALAASMAGDTDSLGRPVSAHTSTKGASTKAATAAGGASHAGTAGQGSTSAGGVDDSEEEEDAVAAPGVPAKANRPVSRRNHQELEELARQEELEALRVEVQQYGTTVDTIVRNQTNAGNRTKQYEADLVTLVAETERFEKEVLMKRRTLELLPSARDNIGKLQEQCNAFSQRLLDLAQEWDTHRLPLVGALNEKEDILNKRREKGRAMVEEVKRYRSEMGSMIQDLKDKQDRMQILNEETSKLNKNINRAMYTHRIMDITNQIVKQNKDIDKITNDIRDIQKTINLNSSTLQRADAIAEELIFAAANDRNDPVMVDTYRRLKTLRAKFEDLIGTVSKIGQQEKANRDLETKIDQEQARISSNNFDRIKADLDAIVKENTQLVTQIKVASVKHK